MFNINLFYFNITRPIHSIFRNELTLLLIYVYQIGQDFFVRDEVIRCWFRLRLRTVPTPVDGKPFNLWAWRQIRQDCSSAVVESEHLQFSGTKHFQNRFYNLWMNPWEPNYLQLYFLKEKILNKISKNFKNISFTTLGHLQRMDSNSSRDIGIIGGA